jgi:1-pyrroline-5-carboxylate dehydrogenase
MFTKVPSPINEPVLSYLPNSKEKEEIKKELKRLESEIIEIPCIIGGKEIKTGNVGKCVEPHNHSKVLATYHKAGKEEVKMAIEAALNAKKEWENMPHHHRSAILLKAAELLTTKYRATINAMTMLNQSKTVHQAEIEAACELADFWRFNPHYMQEIYKEQPPMQPKGIWNYCEHRALEGFVFAITPFNFTAIAGNLPTAPALMGNVVLWKPASASVYSSYMVMKILMEAGMPDGVINFLPSSGGDAADYILDSEHLAGIHFTGSTSVFHGIWEKIGKNISKYKTYPRIVGETGGKDFIFVHKSAEKKAVIANIIRGSFEYQGQKCSAASRAYIPKSFFEDIKDDLLKEIKTIKQGDVQDFRNFVSAVIDKKSFDNIKSYLDHAKASDDAEIFAGGNYDDSKGYFIEPTVIIAKKPDYKSMVEEIFGPVITIYLYDEDKFEETLKLCDETSMYGLTGAIFSQDRYVIIKAMEILKNAAGNFYINDKPTGAIVGQQPFGGARGSGTNDKAGAVVNLLKWTSMRSIKENFYPNEDYRYPFLEEK